MGRVRISRGWRRYVRECSRAVIYRPVEGVDWDLIRSNADDGLVGKDVEEEGMRGGS